MMPIDKMFLFIFISFVFRCDVFVRIRNPKETCTFIKCSIVQDLPAGKPGVSAPQADLNLFQQHALQASTHRQVASHDWVESGGRDYAGHDLKREYQQWLQERNRGRPDSDARPDRDPREIERWARERDLPYFDDRVRFPDFRIEYELDRRDRHEDVEVVTEHYRGAHVASVARPGFRCYGRGSGRSGGFDARVAPHQYLQLTPLVGVPGGVEKGLPEGDNLTTA